MVKRALVLVFSLAVTIACSAQTLGPQSKLWGSRTGNPGTQTRDLSKGSINWAPDLATAQAHAVRSGKLILLHFKGEQCPPCERVEKKVFSQSHVAYQINSRFVPVQINATALPHIARQFEVTSWPTDLVLTSDGQELHRTTSPQAPRDYLAELGKSVWRAQNLIARQTARVAQPAQYAAATQYPAAATQQPAVAQIPNQMPSTGRPNVAQTSAQRSLPLPPTTAQAATQRPASFLPRTSSRAAGTERFAEPTQPQTAQLPPTRLTPPSNFASTANLSAATANPQQPAPARTTTPDLYVQDRGNASNIQLQGHAPTDQTQQAARRIASHAPSSTVQQTSHNSVELPHGQNPFGPNVNNGQPGPAMLNNPFARQAPAPAAPAAAPPQYRVANTVQPAQRMPIQPQPQLNPIQQPAMQPPMQPAIKAATPVAPEASMPSNPMATLTPPAMPSQGAPTPALTAVAPPATQLAAGPSLAGPTGLPTPTADTLPTIDPVPAAESFPTTQPPPTTEPTTVAESAQPDNASEQPDNLVMDGFCPVALMNEENWVPGDSRWGAQHRGKVFLFGSKTAQQEFLADPDKYSPLLSGYDPVVFHETGKLSTGLRAHGVRYQDMTCLFSSEESLQRFWKSPWLFTQSAKQAMRTDTHVR